MTPVPKTVAVPFLLALSGVLLIVGLVVGRLLGPIAVAVYVLLLVAPLAWAAVLGRRRQVRLAAGRTCTCCTGTVHDPVQVV